MPSAPAAVAARSTALRPTPGREAESFEGYESFSATLPAGTSFSVVGTFSGRPDSIVVRNFGTGNIFVRLSDPGEGKPAETAMLSTTEREFKVGRRILEARDPSGGGGQFVEATGRYITRRIDVRNHEGGPRQTHVHEHQDATAEQVNRS